MITIIDKYTEEVLFAMSSEIEIELLENQVAVEGFSGDFTHYSFENKKFYNKE